MKEIKELEKEAQHGKHAIVKKLNEIIKHINEEIKRKR